MEIGIARTNAPDAVLSHQNSRVGIVKNIPRKEGQFVKHGGRNLLMPLRRNEDTQPRRSEKR